MDGVVLNALVRELQKSPIKPYFSSARIIQSSVGLIFRCKKKVGSLYSLSSQIQPNDIEAVDLLMVQRGGYEKDPNAFNIVFPGGQADEGQTDLQACKREVNEEVALNVDELCTYIGQFPTNFYYSKKRGRIIYITCHAWLIDFQTGFIPKLNPQELVDYRWVPFLQILSSDSMTIYTQSQLSIFRRMGWEKLIADIIKKYFVSASMPAIKVGMKRQMWGVTLWIYVYALQMAARSLPNGEQTQLITKIHKNMLEIDAKFKQNFILASPLSWVLRKWNYKNRVKPFSYPPVKDTPIITFLIILALLLSVCLLL